MKTILTQSRGYLQPARSNVGHVENPHLHMRDLFKKYLQNQCSPEEVKEIIRYFDVAENELPLRALIAESLEDVESDEDEVKWSPALNEMFASKKKQLNRQTGDLPIQKTSTLIWIGAALVFLAVA